MTVRRMTRTTVALATAVALAAGALVGVPQAAAAGPVKPRPATQREKSVPGRPFTPHGKAADPGLASVLRSAPSVAWPAPGTAEVQLPVADSVDTGGAVRAGLLPVWLAPAGAGHPTG